MIDVCNKDNEADFERDFTERNLMPVHIVDLPVGYDKNTKSYEQTVEALRSLGIEGDVIIIDYKSQRFGRDYCPGKPAGLFVLVDSKQPEINKTISQLSAINKLVELSQQLDSESINR